MGLIKRKQATERHRQVAQAYFRDGKSLEEAMGQAGFSEAYGRRGISCVARDSAPFAEAFSKELEFARKNANGLTLPSDDFQKLVEWRLAVNVVRGKDDGVQSAKLAGQLKRMDMFVRNGDEPQGIFAVLLNQNARTELDALPESLPKNAREGGVVKESE